MKTLHERQPNVCYTRKDGQKTSSESRGSNPCQFLLVVFTRPSLASLSLCHFLSQTACRRFHRTALRRRTIPTTTEIYGCSDLHMRQCQLVVTSGDLEQFQSILVPEVKKEKKKSNCTGTEDTLKKKKKKSSFS